MLMLMLMMGTTPMMMTDASPMSMDSGSKMMEARTPLDRDEWIVYMNDYGNYVRKRYSMPPLKLDRKLCEAAQNHANYMARTGAFDHYVNGTPQSRAEKYGFKYFVSENIVMGYTDVPGSFAGWEGSPAHFSNMIGDWNCSGFGCQWSKEGILYCVGMYSNKPAEKPKAEAEAKAESGEPKAEEAKADEAKADETAKAE